MMHPFGQNLLNLYKNLVLQKKVVNLTQINDKSKENDAIVVPGKILATGNIDHKITICSFSISSSAAKKIIQSGGNVFSFSQMIEKFPTGKGVNIIG